MAKLGDICTVVSGSTPKTTVPEYWNGNINWITPAEIDDSTIIIKSSQRKITPAGVKSCGLTSFPTGTVILSSRAPIGKTAIAGTEMYCNQGFKNLICGEQIYNKYLFWFLRNNTQYLQSLGRGATFKEISKAIVENIDIPLPPLPEQRHIAAVLDKVSELIALRKKQLALLDEMVKARFVEMFGDPVRNEKGWEQFSLQELCDGIGDGLHGTPAYDDDGEFAFINGNNLMYGRIVVNSTTKRVNKLEYEKYYIDISLNAVLLSINGSLGKLAYYNDEKIILGKSACYCNLKNGINKIFIFHVMNSNPFQNFLEESSTKSTIKNVGLKAIREYKMIQPPIELQNQFADFVQQVNKSKSTVQQGLDRLILLKSALMQEYFG